MPDNLRTYKPKWSFHPWSNKKIYLSIPFRTKLFCHEKRSKSIAQSGSGEFISTVSWWMDHLLKKTCVPGFSCTRAAVGSSLRILYGYRVKKKKKKTCSSRFISFFHIQDFYRGIPSGKNKKT